MELVLHLKGLLGPSYLGEVEYLPDKLEGGKKCQVIDVSIQSSSLPSLLSLAVISLFPTEVLSASASSH